VTTTKPRTARTAPGSHTRIFGVRDAAWCVTQASVCWLAVRHVDPAPPRAQSPSVAPVETTPRAPSSRRVRCCARPTRAPLRLHGPRPPASRRLNCSRARSSPHPAEGCNSIALETCELDVESGRTDQQDRQPPPGRPLGIHEVVEARPLFRLTASTRRFSE